VTLTAVQRRIGAEVTAAPIATATAEQRLRSFLQADYASVVAILSVVTDSRDAAEDAVAEALARFWERARRGEEVESLRSWVLVVAMNLLRSRARRLATATKHLLRINRQAAASADQSAEVAAVVDLRVAIAQLPPRQRELVVLHYLADLPVAEVAEHLGLAVGTVKAGLHQARDALAANPQLQGQSNSGSEHTR
jgi:RNA polymerase sigma factor (sigma-70 family)